MMRERYENAILAELFGENYNRGGLQPKYIRAAERGAAFILGALERPGGALVMLRNEDEFPGAFWRVLVGLPEWCWTSQQYLTHNQVEVLRTFTSSEEFNQFRPYGRNWNLQVGKEPDPERRFLRIRFDRMVPKWEWSGDADGPTVRGFIVRERGRGYSGGHDTAASHGWVTYHTEPPLGAILSQEVVHQGRFTTYTPVTVSLLVYE